MNTELNTQPSCKDLSSNSLSSNDSSCIDIASHPLTTREKPASACPGLLRIVPALDGGICRIKLAGGAMNSTQALALADAADQFANASLELTNRANIQIRAVRLPDANAMVQGLLAAGLGPDLAGEQLPMDIISGADDIRNLMISPAAGVDPDAIFDVTPLARQLLMQLQQQPRFHALSAKFAVLLDGGERTAMLQHPHDIWLSALPSSQGVLFAFGLAGCPPQTTTQDDAALGAVTPSQVPLLVDALLHTFLDLVQPGQTRMRHLVGDNIETQLPIADFLQSVQRRLDFSLSTDAEISHWRRRSVTQHTPLGILPQRNDGRVQIGITPALGRLSTHQMRGILALVDTIEEASLRVTPWQSLLLRNIPAARATTLLSDLRALHLYTDTTDPLTQIIACTGSAGCAKGLADTKQDALRLASYLQVERPESVSPLPGVHLTGCRRSCAAAHTAPFTLLATEYGRYSLFMNKELMQKELMNSDHTQGFGTLIESSISIEHAANLLNDLFKTHAAQERNR